MPLKMCHNHNTVFWFVNLPTCFGHSEGQENKSKKQTKQQQQKTPTKNARIVASMFSSQTKNLNTKTVTRNAKFNMTLQKYANFQGKPSFQSDKTTVNKPLNDDK